MRVLIVGGAGYIGSHAARLFLEQGHDAWVFDNLSMGHRAAAPPGRLIVGHLADADLLGQVLAEHRVEVVVHFAALSFVGDSVRRPDLYYRNNVADTLTLLEQMRRHGLARLVFSSTCATYGTPRQVPVTEDEPQRPINPYGNTKLAVERALLDYAAAFDWGVALLRYFNAAGARPDGSLGEDHRPETHLIPLAIDAARGRRPPLEVFGTDYPTPDGTCVRDYVHVEDLAAAHVQAVERLRPGGPLVCNLGTGRGHSVREVIRAVEEVTGLKVPAREGPRRDGDPSALVAAAGRARDLLGWVPRYTDLRETVQTAWNWHRAHPDGYGD